MAKSKRGRKPTRFVPRMVGVSLVCVVPACAGLAGCNPPTVATDAFVDTGRRDSGYSVADISFDNRHSVAADAFSVADSGFSVADSGFSVADSGFSVADSGFGPG